MSACLGGMEYGIGLELWGGIQGRENLILLDHQRFWQKGRRLPWQVVEISRLNLSRIKTTPMT